MGLGQDLAPQLDMRTARTVHTPKLGVVGAMGWPADNLGERVEWSWGSAGFVGTLLRLYHDRCLSVIVSVRDIPLLFQK